MSSYIQPKIKAMKAEENLANYQYGFVKFGTNKNGVVRAGANEKSCGVLMNAPGLGESAEVALPGGGALVKITENLSAGALLTPTSDSFGEQVDAADEWCGAQMQEAGSANDVVPVIVCNYYSSKSDA